MLKISTKGDFKNTEKYLTKIKQLDYTRILNKYGQEGVKALASATPTSSGLTAKSWYYEVSVQKNGKASITWLNSNTVKGVPVAILLQYGHSTRNGGYVTGIDFVNPALKPIFEKIANDVWREVTS